MAGFGSLGGLGGYVNDPARGGNMLQALGMSLMSSPRNAPLANFGKFYTGLQDQQMQLDERDQQRNSLAAALKSFGFSDDEAMQLSANPTAAKIAIEQRQMQAQKEEAARFNSGLLGIMGGDDAAGAVAAPAGGVSGYPAMSDTTVSDTAPTAMPAPPTQTQFGQYGVAQMDPNRFTLGNTPADTGSLEPVANIPQEPVPTAADQSGNKTLEWLKANDPEAASLVGQDFSVRDAFDIAQVRRQSRGQGQGQGGEMPAAEPPRQVTQASQPSKLQKLMGERDQLYRLAMTAPKGSEARVNAALQYKEQQIAKEQDALNRNKTFNAIASEDPELAQNVLDGLVPVGQAYKQLLDNRKFRFEQEQGDRTSGTKEYDAYARDEIAAGRQPLGRLAYEQALRQAGATNVNVGAGEKAWDQESAKLFAKRYDDITAAAGNAQQMMGMYDLAEQALNSGVRTGLGADAELTLRQLGAAMGMDTDPDKLAGGELIRAVQNRMALTMRSPDGGMGMPGALSDRDIKFLKDSQIGIDRSPEGNRRMLEAFRAMERRKVEIAQLADQYVQDNGRLDSGFNRTVRQWAEANPLFPEASRSGDVAKPTTQEDFDALPSGATYIDPDDGKTYRKP